MSTYLQLCKDVVRECRIPEAMTAVAGQTDELERVVEWVKNAWLDIQNRHPDWRWMRVEFTLNTTADKDAYVSSDATDVLTSSAITRFSRWRVNDYENPPNIFLQSSGVGTETWLTWIEWNSFKWLYRRGTQNAQYPAHISVDPQDKLVLGPKPNDVYVVSGDYQRSAQILAADGDIPEMPVHYHPLIMYRAIEKYAYTESETGLLAWAQKEGNRIMRQLETEQLPAMRVAGPLA